MGWEKGLANPKAVVKGFQIPGNYHPDYPMHCPKHKSG
jgi:hypothetical protein